MAIIQQNGSRDSQHHGQTSSFKTRTTSQGFSAFDHQRRAYAGRLVGGALSESGFHQGCDRDFCHRGHRRPGESPCRKTVDAAFWLEPVTNPPVDGMAGSALWETLAILDDCLCHKSATRTAYRAGLASPRMHFPLELGRVKKFRGLFRCNSRFFVPLELS